MSFWKKLFGGGDGAGKEDAAVEVVEHKGFSIRPAPFMEDGQYQTCGYITKVVDGETREHRLVRADRFASRDDAIEVTLRQARHGIEEQGARIFS